MFFRQINHVIRTYIFDQFGKKDIETIFDKIGFFTDLELGIDVNEFILKQ